MTDKTLQELQELWVTVDRIEQTVRSNRIYFTAPIGKQPEASHALNDSAAVVLVLGSNRSGKSVWGVLEVIAHAFGKRLWLPEDHPDYIVRLTSGAPIPVPNVGRIIAQNYQQAVQQTIIPLIEEWAPTGTYEFKKDNRGIPTSIHWKNGSKVFIMSNDQDDMAFEGPKGHYVWADEPIDYNKYVGLKRGLVDYSGHIFLTLTPLTQPWIHDILVNRANEQDGQVRLFKFSIWDNCIDNGGYLRREDIEEFLADLKEHELEARLHGNFLHLAGKVFREWVPEPPFWVQPRKLPETWPRVCVIDPHPRKPIAVVWLAFSPDDRVYVYRDLYEKSLYTVNDVCDKIKELEGWRWSKSDEKWVWTETAENVVMRIIDDSAKENERTSGDSVWQRFATNGLVCRLAKKGNINAGIDAIHEALKVQREWNEPGLVVHNNCLHVKHNFLNFCWAEWATGKQADLREEKQEARKKDDDFIACIRYAYQMGLSYRTLRSSNPLQERYDNEGEEIGVYRPALQGPLTRRERQRLWQTSSKQYDSLDSNSRKMGLLSSLNPMRQQTKRIQNRREIE